jgi:hypothetical protein
MYIDKRRRKKKRKRKKGEKKVGSYGSFHMMKKKSLTYLWNFRHSEFGNFSRQLHFSFIVPFLPFWLSFLLLRLSCIIEHVFYPNKVSHVFYMVQVFFWKPRCPF